LRAGEDRYPAGEWAAREREALDALRVLAGFLELHAADPITQAITTHLTLLRRLVSANATVRLPLAGGPARTTPP
jgi:hypothetical protein